MRGCTRSWSPRRPALRRAQHGVLVLPVQLLEARILHQHLVGEPAMVEHRSTRAPGRGPSRAGWASPPATQTGRAIRPRDGRGRGRLADADLRRLRRQQHLGGAHVGPAPQQVRGHVGNHVQGDLGDLFGAAAQARAAHRADVPAGRSRVVGLSQVAAQLRMEARVLRYCERACCTSSSDRPHCETGVR